jgi:LemA protein
MLAEITAGIWVLIAVAVFFVIFIPMLIGIYNRLVTMRNRYKNAYSQIDVQLKRRYDLIPNLVETAKGYLKHERETLEAVIAARNAAQSASQTVAGDPGNPESMKALLGAEATLTGSLGKLFALSEAYPDLKGNENMKSLMEELTSTENKISFARQAFNDSVTSYNTGCETFPNSILAGMFSFKLAELFEVESPQEREVVKVSF